MEVILYLGRFDPYKPYKALKGLLRLTSWGSSGPCLGQLGPIFEQTWVYLKLFEAILGNLEAILGTSSKKILKHGKCHLGRTDFLFKLGPIFSDLHHLFHHFWDHFVGSFFGHFLDPFWKPFWHPFWTHLGPRGAKVSPRRPPDTSEIQKPAFSKTLKNL